MLVNLEPYPQSTGTTLAADVDQDSTVEDLIILYRHENLIDDPRSMIVWNGNDKPLPKEKTLLQLGIPNGHTLKIGFEDEIQPTRKRWLKMAVAGGIVGAVVFISLALSLYFIFKNKKQIKSNLKEEPILEESNLFLRNKNLWCNHSPKNYGVVVDDGELNTCAALYSWNKYKGTACAKEVNECCIKNNKGGLASKNPENHIKRITICIKGVTNRFQDTKHITVHVVASLRYQIGDGRTANISFSTVNRVREYLLRAGFVKIDVKILSGEEEALYGWIAAAYLSDAFKGEMSPGYGYMDLGDRTTKISFNTSKGTNITLYGAEYKIFSKSYPCFGKRSAKERYQSFLLKNVAVTEIEDPCLPHNESETKSEFEMFWGMCTKSNRFTHKFFNRTYTFKGSDDSFYCRKNISKILIEEDCLKYAFSECFQKIVVPEDTKFLAHSNFFSIMKFINLQRISLNDFSEIANNCYHLHDIKSVIKEKKRLVELCFGLQYIYELLVSGYGFTDTTWNNIKFVGNEHTEDFSWTLGYVIHKS